MKLVSIDRGERRYVFYVADDEQFDFEKILYIDIHFLTTREPPSFKHLSFLDRTKIEEMIKSGFPLPLISRKLGRSYAGIRLEVLKNGGREAYCATEAEARKNNTRKKLRKKQEISHLSDS